VASNGADVEAEASEGSWWRRHKNSSFAFWKVGATLEIDLRKMTLDVLHFVVHGTFRSTALLVASHSWCQYFSLETNYFLCG
jgi:hypothetical protein